MTVPIGSDLRPLLSLRVKKLEASSHEKSQLCYHGGKASCNFEIEFPELHRQNFVCCHWLNTPGKSEIMDWGIVQNVPRSNYSLNVPPNCQKWHLLIWVLTVMVCLAYDCNFYDRNISDHNIGKCFHRIFNVWVCSGTSALLQFKIDIMLF